MLNQISGYLWAHSCGYINLAIKVNSPDHLKDVIYLFLERGKGREEERERNINVWLPLTCPIPITWPVTQACALTRTQTGDPLVHRPELNPLSCTSQGNSLDFLKKLINTLGFMYKNNKHILKQLTIQESSTYAIKNNLCLLYVFPCGHLSWY